MFPILTAGTYFSAQEAEKRFGSEGAGLRKHHEWGARFGRREAPGEPRPREGPVLQPNPAWQEGQDLEVGILSPLSLEPRVEISVQNESGREFPGGQTLNNAGTPVCASMTGTETGGPSDGSLHVLLASPVSGASGHLLLPSVGSEHFTAPWVTPVPLPSCHWPWGFSVAAEVRETPRGTLGPPKGNPDVPRFNTPRGQGSGVGAGA